MSYFVDYTGRRFGKLVVLERGNKNKKRGTYNWICKCDCGNIKQVNMSDLRDGGSKSCGCMSSRNFAGERTKTHGMSKTKQYGVWRLMNERCSRPKNKSYKDYGAKGIRVEWETFEEFWEDMREGYKEGLTIDRIDSKGNYCKDNCRWVTRAEQNRNKSDNIMISYKGNFLPLKTMCIKYGVDYKKAYYRYTKKNMSFEDIMKTIRRK